MKYVGKTIYALFILMLVSVAGLFLATMLPIPGGLEVKIVKSGSMEPAILTGSLVFVQPADSYAVGDVVTFGEDTKAQIPTTHRIIAVENVNGQTAFATKGDANEERDPQPILASNIIGKVWFSIPYAGFVLDFARQPMGFTLMIGIPAVLIIIDEVLRISMEVSKLRRRKRDEEEIEEAFREVSPSGKVTPRAETRHFDIPHPTNNG